MNFTRLRYFLAVADEAHFGRAAARLHIAQPPLSQQIRQLETELGVALFDRSTRPITLTAAAKVLYPDALRLVTSANALRRKMAQVADGHAGVLRLGFVGSSSYSVLPTFVQAFQNQWPAVEWEFTGLSSDNQASALLRDEIDLGISRFAPTDPAITATPFMTERLFVAVTSDHTLTSQKRVLIADLVGESLVGSDRSTSPTLHHEMHELFRRRNLRYDPKLEASDYTTIVGLAAAGRDLAIVPASVRAVQPPNLSYLELADDDAVSSFMVLRRTDDTSPLAGRATDLISDLFSA